MASNPLSLSPFIVSLREFSRNPEMRKKALKQNKPVIVEQSRDDSFFVLLPPAVFNKLNEMYRDMRDTEELKKAMEEETEFFTLEEVEAELCK